MPRPLVLVTTATAHRDAGLRRQDAVTGRNYSQALDAEGVLPLMVANLGHDSAEAFMARADGLLLTGGCDVDPALYGRAPRRRLGVVDPERDAFELALYRAARARGLPVLGICRGLQVVNVAEGGTLHQHLGDLNEFQHDQADIDGRPLHRVDLVPGSRAAAAAGATTVTTNSHHHQGVDDLAPTLRAVGMTGDGLVEAVEGVAGAWLCAVQWHPEMTYATHPEGRWPFRAFAEALGVERRPAAYRSEPADDPAPEPERA